MTRRARGFTLVELGIVLAVVAVLFVGVGSGLQGYRRFAESKRTALEISSLINAGINAAFRNVDVKTGCTDPTVACVSTEPALSWLGAYDLTVADGLCFDLSKTPTVAPALTAPGAGSGWGGTAVPSTEVAKLLGDPLGGVIPNEGKNHYGNPYVLCVYRRRVAVLTCVPEDPADPGKPRDDMPGIGSGTPDPCPGAPWAFSCVSPGDTCISAGAALVPPNLSRLAITYKYLYWGEATRDDAVP